MTLALWPAVYAGALIGVVVAVAVANGWFGG